MAINNPPIRGRAFVSVNSPFSIWSFGAEGDIDGPDGYLFNRVVEGDKHVRVTPTAFAHAQTFSTGDPPICLSLSDDRYN